MTVIAYKAGIMASDSRCVTGTEIISDIRQKLHRCSDGSLMGFTGEAGAAQVIEDLFKTKGGHPTPEDLMATKQKIWGMVVRPSGRIYCLIVNGKSSFTEIGHPFWADGSGGDIAKGAMAAGATAREAVEIACRFETGWGGRIQTLKLGKTR